MPEYDLNDYDRERTRDYTPEEIELNKKLYEECTNDNVDFSAVEELLKQGADPLGTCDIFENVYREIVAESQSSDSVDLPKLTELFLKYGMDIDAPRIPYDDEENCNPLWSFSFVANENAIKALKMLLDNGLSAESFSEFWDHSMTDFFQFDCDDPENDEFAKEHYIWTFKMLLLGASYDHIIDNDDELGEFICCFCNTSDIHIFRNWDDFEYHFDTSYCDKAPKLYGSIIHIFSKKTGEEVWKIGVGKAGKNALINHCSQ